MKIVEINAVPYGSTGRIAKSICNLANSNGYDQAYFCYSWVKMNKYKTTKNEILIGGLFSKSLNILLSFLFGKEGVHSKLATLIFLKKLKKIKPDVVHLHIMHSWYINVPMLFRFCNKYSVKIYWTFHDCWAFTGHCPHFLLSGCDKWKVACSKCPSYKEYPQSLFDNSKKMYFEKKKWSKLANKATIITPSYWLQSLLPFSLFKNNESVVINNGIDLDLFKPTFCQIEQKYNIDKSKKIILGIAYSWEKRKGIFDFLKLSELIDNSWQIVLVGYQVEKINFGKNVILIDRTQNQQDLAALYTLASVFVNPTYEDNFPTVNIEALSCGTPVVTYETGGSAEIITKNTGLISKKGDINNLYKSIRFICDNIDIFSSEECRKQASNFNKNNKFQEYLDLFHGK